MAKYKFTEKFSNTDILVSLDTHRVIYNVSTRMVVLLLVHRIIEVSSKQKFYVTKFKRYRGFPYNYEIWVNSVIL